MVFVEADEIDDWMGLPWLRREEEELAVCCRLVVAGEEVA